FAMPATLQAALPEDDTQLPNFCAYSMSCLANYQWWATVLNAPDQLRQRVAYALSHIWVVSFLGADGRQFPYYFNVLANDAFGNWKTLMHDVTLTGAMGT